MKYIYGDCTSDGLAEARARKWKTMKNKSTQRLPPDADSLEQKSLRVNYQVYLFLHYKDPEAPAEPVGHGWCFTDNVCRPVRYTRPALPKELVSVLSYSETPDERDRDTDTDELTSDTDINDD